MSAICLPDTRHYLIKQLYRRFQIDLNLRFAKHSRRTAGENHPKMPLQIASASKISFLFHQNGSQYAPAVHLVHRCHLFLFLFVFAEIAIFSFRKRVQQKTLQSTTTEIKRITIMNITRSLNNWRKYRQTVTELARMTDRELNDLGIGRGDIRRVARTAVGY
jgi:uncharacterized protein YjiS (DUF1127 family)